MPASNRKMIDCRKFPDSTCAITIAGPEDEVLALAVLHAVKDHGHENTPDLREQLRTMLVDEPAEAHV
jgi:hypothetical protein